MFSFPQFFPSFVFVDDCDDLEIELLEHLRKNMTKTDNVLEQRNPQSQFAFRIRYYFHYCTVGKNQSKYSIFVLTLKCI